MGSDYKMYVDWRLKKEAKPASSFIPTTPQEFGSRLLSIIMTTMARFTSSVRCYKRLIATRLCLGGWRLLWWPSVHGSMHRMSEGLKMRILMLIMGAWESTILSAASGLARSHSHRALRYVHEGDSSAETASRQFMPFGSLRKHFVKWVSLTEAWKTFQNWVLGS